MRMATISRLVRPTRALSSRLDPMDRCDFSVGSRSIDNRRTVNADSGTGEDGTGRDGMMFASFTDRFTFLLRLPLPDTPRRINIESQRGPYQADYRLDRNTRASATLTADGEAERLIIDRSLSPGIPADRRVVNNPVRSRRRRCRVANAILSLMGGDNSEDEANSPTITPAWALLFAGPSPSDERQRRSRTTSENTRDSRCVFSCCLSFARLSCFRGIFRCPPRAQINRGDWHTREGARGNTRASPRHSPPPPPPSWNSSRNHCGVLRVNIRRGIVPTRSGYLRNETSTRPRLLTQVHAAALRQVAATAIRSGLHREDG